MPTINLLEADPNMSNAIFRDENGNLPVIKSLNRLGNVVYTVPNNNAQIVYRILLYDALDTTSSMLDRLITIPNVTRLRLDTNVRVERRSQTDWNGSYNNNGIPRKLTGLKFLVEVPNHGSWGREQSYTARTASVSNGKITLNEIKRALREVTNILRYHTAHEMERQTADRIMREEWDRLNSQSVAFMQEIVALYPLESRDAYTWHDNYTALRLTIRLDKFQIAKVFDAIHNVRHMQVNPLDAEYLFKKDY